MSHAALLPLFAMLAFAGAGESQAEVRFGRNVSIGGHDFSHRTYNAKRRGVIYLHKRKPRREGCTWRADGRGGRVQTCHLRRIGRR